MMEYHVAVKKILSSSIHAEIDHLQDNLFYFTSFFVFFQQADI